MKISKKLVVTFAVIFFAGFAGGILTEHVIHHFQGNNAGEHHSHAH